MSRQNCEVIRPLLSVYLDNEATAAEADLVEAHTAACAQCDSELGFLFTTHVALRRLPEAMPPASLRTRIAQATYARPTFAQRVAAFVRPAPTRLALGSALAAGVAVAVVVLRGPAVPPSQVVVAPPVQTQSDPEAVPPPNTHPLPESIVRPQNTQTAKAPKASPKPARQSAVAENAPVRNTTLTTTTADKAAERPATNATVAAAGPKAPANKTMAMVRTQPQRFPGTVVEPRPSPPATANPALVEPPAPAPEIEVAVAPPATPAPIMVASEPVRGLALDGKIPISRPRMDPVTVSFDASSRTKLASQNAFRPNIELGQSQGGGTSFVTAPGSL